MDDWSTAHSISNEIKQIWQSINPRLPLINDKTIDKNVNNLIVLVKQINQKRAKAVKQQNLETKINKLFDVSACGCSLETVPCNDRGVKCKKLDCQEEHILCICTSMKKVPVEERKYLRNQHQKLGPKGTYQMSTIDGVAVKRDQRRIVGPISSHSTIAQNIDERVDENFFTPNISESFSDCKNLEEEWKLENKTIKSSYNVLKLPRFATELVRGNCSSTLGAALANALFYDIKHLLCNDVKIEETLLDKCKLDRAKANIRVVCDEKHKEEKRNLVCIRVDEKVDSNTQTYTTVHASDGSMLLKQSFDAEHHLTFMEETETASGIYLTHKVIPMTGATGELLAEKAYNVLEEHGSVTSIKALLVDNTATNTGLKNDLVSNLEDKLQQNLHLIGCALHQNELPLRAIFKKLDGSTTGPASFSGHLARQCGENWNQIPQVEFQPTSAMS